MTNKASFMTMTGDLNIEKASGSGATTDINHEDNLALTTQDLASGVCLTSLSLSQPNDCATKQTKRRLTNEGL